MDNDFRRVDPSNPKWDRSVRIISGNPVELAEQPDWTELVKAEQLSSFC